MQATEILHVHLGNLTYEFEIFLWEHILIVGTDNQNTEVSLVSYAWRS